MRVRKTVWCISSVLFLTGCPDVELAPLDPCTVSVVDQSVGLNPVDKVDVLFVIDDSGSMHAEQEQLKAQLPRMVEALATGHIDDDDVQDFPPVRDLHLGVVSSDMGALHAREGDGCGTSEDGRLQNGAGRCAATTEGLPFIRFMPDPAAGDLATQARTLGERFGCLAELGTSGCGHEQQLEAALKALTPSSSPLRFSGGSVGHADGANAGFLREDSVVAVIVVTDEDDCSHPDESAFLTDPAHEGAGLNVRCGRNPQATYPAARYVEGLRALRPGREENVIFGAIVGVPLDASGQPAEAILQRPEMVFETTFEEQEGGYTVEVAADVCTSEAGDGGGAAAALRIVDVAAQFGEQSSVHSICAGDYRPAVDAILQKIGEQLEDACLPRPLDRRGGVVPCEVHETLQPGRTCDAARGREHVEDVEGHPVCRVKQLAVRDAVVDPGPGWYYDDFSADAVASCPSALRIAFAAGFEPDGVAIDFECLQSVRRPAQTARGRHAVGNPCPQQGCHTLDDDTSALFCAADSQTCQLPCSVDDDCPGAWRCAAPVGTDGVQVEPRCINPRCDR